jgi:hypothetical protein
VSSPTEWESMLDLVCLMHAQMHSRLCAVGSLALPTPCGRPGAVQHLQHVSALAKWAPMLNLVCLGYCVLLEGSCSYAHSLACRWLTRSPCPWWSPRRSSSLAAGECSVQHVCYMMTHPQVHSRLCGGGLLVVPAPCGHPGALQLLQLVSDIAQWYLSLVWSAP